MRRVGRTTNSNVRNTGGGMFAEELKQILMNVNKSELARVLGCHRDTIAKWVVGKQTPGVAYLLRMCIYLYPEQWEQAYLRFSVLIEADK